MKQSVQQLSPLKAQVTISDLMVLANKDYVLEVFDHLVIIFLNELSKTILRDPQLNRIPATAALGFWLRKSHINQMINENEHLKGKDKIHISPVGTVFHVCPSNVDTMFLYSLAISLLSGNKNILRISQRVSDPILDKIFNIINEVVNKDEFRKLENYISIITYGHDEEINRYFSSLADVRIIWGGDATINTFKKIPSGTRTRDIAFADRISCSIFNASIFLSSSQDVKKETARKFFNDSYTFDQLGCSSPQELFVLGNELEMIEFENEFYNLLLSFAEGNYNNDIASIASLKLNKLALDSIEIPDTINAITKNNYLYFVNMDSGNESIFHSAGAGYFYIQRLENISDIKAMINKKLQTISYFGLSKEDIQAMSDYSKGKGIDRIVPIGSTLDFEYIWDGYNLFDELTVKKWVV